MTTTFASNSNHDIPVLSLDDLFDDSPIPVYIPRKQGYVYIRPPRADSAFRSFRKLKGETDEQAENKRLEMVALCLCDKDGNLLLQPSQYHRVRSLGFDVYTCVSRFVIKLVSGEPIDGLLAQQEKVRLGLATSYEEDETGGEKGETEEEMEEAAEGAAGKAEGNQGENEGEAGASKVEDTQADTDLGNAGTGGS